MSMQIQIQKPINQFNFLESTMYDRHDLTNLVKNGEKFVVRQGDLVITNYDISDRRKRGLRYAWLDKYKDKNTNILVFAGNHFVIPLGDETIIAHPEHGVVVIPLEKDKLNFYTFSNAID